MHNALFKLTGDLTPAQLRGLDPASLIFGTISQITFSSHRNASLSQNGMGAEVARVVDQAMKDGAKMVTERVDTKPAEALP
ncbi:MAG TPA: hypothetical protein VFY67_00465 [Pyrinomonadaceae bacterium]|nr:hypothetical protein [Pyrinomonadaceae bacterium]